VVDLDRRAVDGVGEPEPPDVLAGAVADRDREARVDVGDVVDRGIGPDLAADADAVAVVRVRLGRPRDGRAREAVALIVGERVGPLGDEVAGGVDGDRRRAGGGVNRTGFRGDPGDWISRGLGGRA